MSINEQAFEAVDMHAETDSTPPVGQIFIVSGDRVRHSESNKCGEVVGTDDVNITGMVQVLVDGEETEEEMHVRYLEVLERRTMADVLAEGPEPGVTYRVVKCGSVGVVKPHDIDRYRAGESFSIGVERDHSFFSVKPTELVVIGREFDETPNTVITVDAEQPDLSRPRVGATVVLVADPFGPVGTVIDLQGETAKVRWSGGLEEFLGVDQITTIAPIHLVASVDSPTREALCLQLNRTAQALLEAADGHEDKHRALASQILAHQEFLLAVML